MLALVVFLRSMMFICRFIEVKRWGSLEVMAQGKSTLLKILSRITSPTRGRVGVAGRIGCLLEVGTGFHPELTGRENVFLNGSILGMSRREIRKRFDEIVEFAEVEQFLDMPVKRYSNGMLVRLGFFSCRTSRSRCPDCGRSPWRGRCSVPEEESREGPRVPEPRTNGAYGVAQSSNDCWFLHTSYPAARRKASRRWDSSQVIERHLSLSSTEKTDEEQLPHWDDSQRSVGTEYMQIKSIDVVDASGFGAVTVQSDIDTHITYEVIESGHRVCLQLTLVDESGIPSSSASIHQR